MLIRQSSDIHTEFMAKEQHKISRIVERDILPPLDTDAETTLILAGDIGSMHKPKCLEEFFAHVAPRFKYVLYIPGNHEGYGGQMDTMIGEVKKITDKYPNVFFNDKLLMVLDGVTFAGCTLWTDMNGGDQKTIAACGNSMNDYRLIDYDHSRALRVVDTMALHVDHRAFLEQSWKADVIFTHHSPSLRSINKKYLSKDPEDFTSLMNGAYHNDLDGLVMAKGAKYWLHGHCHDPVRYFVGDTQVICNPKGYVGEKGISGYDPKLVLEV